MTSGLSYVRPVLWDVIAGGKPYIPLDWQARHIHARKELRIIAACGRRAGKTTAVIAEVVKEVMRPQEIVMGIPHAPLVYIVGPTHETAYKAWGPVWDLFVPPESGSFDPPLGFMRETHDKNRGYIKLINGAQIYRKSADDERSLQGDRVTLAICDESHDIDDSAWEYLMPSLADSGGRLIAIGIPKGIGRFRSYWLLGQNEDADFYSFSVPTTANPVFKMQAEAKGYDDVTAYVRDTFAPEMTDDEFARQYLAEWREEEGQVFDHFERRFNVKPQTERANGQKLVMGLDVGKMQDKTVAYIGDANTGKFVAMDAFNGIEYATAAPRIANLAKHFGVLYVKMEANGTGEAFADLLKREGIAVIPFHSTNDVKNGMISTMIREIQRENVQFLYGDDMLRKEMETFQATVKGNVVRYGAPKGYHDDHVMAAAILTSEMAKRHGYSTVKQKNYAKFGANAKKSYMPSLPTVKAS